MRRLLSRSNRELIVVPNTSSCPSLATPAVLLAALVLVFFANKAYNIDDSYFLFQAKQVLVDPLHPSAFDIQWINYYGRASELSPTGPGMAYILAPIVALGAPEWAAHGLMFIFLALGVLGMVRLAPRFGLSARESSASALLLISFPPVMVMASTSMPDVPAMVMGLWAIERWMAFLAGGRWWTGGLAAMLMSMAILTRTHAIMLLAVCLLIAGHYQNGDTERSLLPARLNWVHLWPLAVTFALVVALSALTSDTQGGTQNLLSFLNFVSLRRFPHNVIAFFSHLVLLIPIALAWLLIRWRNMSWKLFFACYALAIGLLPASDMQWWWVVPLAGTGAAATVSAFTETWHRKEPHNRALVIWALAALPMIFYVHLPSKYLVLSAPACSLLIVMWSRVWEPARRVTAAVSLCGGGLLLSVMIISADARLADLGRRAADKLIAPHVEAGKRIYYACDWSSWYAHSAGGRPLLEREDEIKRGDLIMTNTEGRKLALRRMVVRTDEVTDKRRGGRVMWEGAGFYSNHWGYLPWVWGSERVDRYELWKIL